MIDLKGIDETKDLPISDVVQQSVQFYTKFLIYLNNTQFNILANEMCLKPDELRYQFACLWRLISMVEEQTHKKSSIETQIARIAKTYNVSLDVAEKIYEGKILKKAFD